MFQKKISLKTVMPAFFSLLLLLGTATVFHPCEMKEDGTWMHCHDVQTAVITGSIILTVLLSAAAVIKNRWVKLIGYGVTVIGAAVMFFLPGDIMEMCMMHTMRCYAVMRPFVRIMCVLTAISAAFLLKRICKNK